LEGSEPTIAGGERRATTGAREARGLGWAGWWSLAPEGRPPLQSARREPGEQQPLAKIIVEAGRASGSAEAPASAEARCPKSAPSAEPRCLLRASRAPHTRAMHAAGRLGRRTGARGTAPFPPRRSGRRRPRRSDRPRSQSAPPLWGFLKT
jgi:hypothetical protein